MNETATKYRENKISKLMLMLTMVIGFFTFSGFSGNLGSASDQKTAQTEVVIRTPRKSGYKIISYAYAVSLLKADHAPRFHLVWKMALLSFNNFMKAQFAWLSLLPSLQHPVQPLRLTGPVPQISNEEEPLLS
jgi:hypothetical protein